MTATVQETETGQETERKRVPLIRWWIWGTLAEWTQAIYGRRRSHFYIFGWWFFIFWAIGQFIRLNVWLAGIAIILATFIITAICDLISYHWRAREAREQERQEFIDSIA